MKSTKASLKRLKTDYIVLFFIHGWDQQVPVEETLRALSDLKAQGKIRFYSGSNLAGWQLERVISTARALAMDLPAAVQVKYNLLERGIELELMPCCIENGVAVLPWSPLAGGWLTGKLSSEPKPHWCNAAWGKPRARRGSLRETKRAKDLCDLISAR